jgi:hypothetical protein
MKPVGAQRLSALAVSISVTFLLVWSMGSLGYPATASPTAMMLAAAACDGAR